METVAKEIRYLRLERLKPISINKNRRGETIQFLGLVLLGVGITLEIIYQGEIFLIMITVGSLFFAVGTKIKGG